MKFQTYLIIISGDFSQDGWLVIGPIPNTSLDIKIYQNCKN